MISILQSLHLSLLVYSISMVSSLTAQAQILPTSSSKIQIDKTHSIKLNEEEVTANKDWAFMWHWLNNPSHHEYKDEMIKSFKKYTYEEGNITKFKRPFIEGLTPNDQTPDKDKHFITRELLQADNLAPFFSASQKLYCKDPDNTGDPYCKKDANRREIWEEKTKEQLLEELDFEQLGTHATFRNANHALVMHQYLECKDERMEFSGESINLARLRDQLINIGNYFNQLTYEDHRLEGKRLRTLARIQTVVPLDEPPVRSAANQGHSAKNQVRSPEDQELPPPPGGQKAHPSQQANHRTQAVHELDNAKRNDNSMDSLERKELKKPLTSEKSRIAVDLDASPDSASTSTSNSDSSQASSKTLKSQTLEFTERLSKMDWTEREKILKGNPVNIFIYYETLTDESREQLIFEESQFYLKEFLSIKDVLASTLSSSPAKVSAEDAKSLAVLKGKLTDAILKPPSPKDLPLVADFAEPSPRVLKELKEWAEQKGEELVSVSSGAHKSDDLLAAGKSLKQRVLSLEKARQEYQKSLLSKRNLAQTKVKFRNEFYQLEEIRAALTKFKTH